MLERIFRDGASPVDKPRLNVSNSIQTRGELNRLNLTAAGRFPSPVKRPRTPAGVYSPKLVMYAYA